MKIKYCEPVRECNRLAYIASGAVVRFPNSIDPSVPWMVLRSNSETSQIVRLSDGKSIQNPSQDVEVEELICTLMVEGVK